MVWDNSIRRHIREFDQRKGEIPMALRIDQELSEEDLEDDHDVVFTTEIGNPSELSPEELGYKSKVIKQSSYEQYDVDKVVQDCVHLSQDQREGLHQVLKKFPELFSGKLGRYKDGQIHLDLDQ